MEAKWLLLLNESSLKIGIDGVTNDDLISQYIEFWVDKTLEIHLVALQAVAM